VHGGRKLGPVLATGIVAGNMIGSGVFLLPATLATVGGISLIGWLFASVGAVALALVFSRLTQRRPLAGGPASHVHAALGPFAGFQASVWYWGACVIGNVAIAAAAAGYLAALVPGLESGAALAAATAGLLWLITLLNLVSPRFVAQLDGLLLIVGVVPLLLVGTAGWALFDPELYRAEWNPGGRPLLEVIPSSLVLVFWAFTGLESASVAAAVVEEPEKNIPIATVAGVGIAALVYISASTVIVGLVPSQRLAASSAPFALAAGLALGGVAGPLIAAAALLKALGTLAGWVLLTAQMGQAAAERGLLPRALARVRNGDTPALGLVVAAGIGTIAVVLSVSPTLGEQFGLLIEASTLFALLTYAAACLAALRGGRSADVVLGLIGAAFCVAVIAGSSSRVLAATGVCALAIALAWLPIARRRRA
jgi:arginine:agmatine antiporter